LDDNFFRAPGHERFLNHLATLASQRDNVRFHRGSPEDETLAHWEVARSPLLSEVTLNLPRAAYETGTEKALAREVETLVRLAARAHQQKLAFLESLMATEPTGPLAWLGQRWHDQPYLDLDRAAGVVSVDGLHECTAVLINQTDGFSEEGIALAERILVHLKEACARQSRDLGIPIMLGANDAAGVSRRFATLDAEHYPKTAQTVIRTHPQDKSLFYSTGCSSPEGVNRTPMERARVEGILAAHLNAPGEARVMLPRDDTRPEAIADFVRIAFTRTGCRRLVFL
jgi:ribonucleoside-triphosphate reductase